MAIKTAWTNRRVRLAYAGYLGHMWELYAMWAWIAAATTVSYGRSLAEADALTLSKITAFVAIGVGAISSVMAGFIADRIGKAEVALIALGISGVAALLTALTFGGPVWLTFTNRGDLGDRDRTRFSSVLGVGRRCRPSRSDRKLDDASNRSRLRAHHRYSSGYSIYSRLVGLASRFGPAGAWAYLWNDCHEQASRHGIRRTITPVRSSKTTPGMKHSIQKIHSYPNAH